MHLGHPGGLDTNNTINHRLSGTTVLYCFYIILYPDSIVALLSCSRFKVVSHVRQWVLAPNPLSKNPPTVHAVSMRCTRNLDGTEIYSPR